MKRFLATLIAAMTALAPVAAGDTTEPTRERYLRFACEGITDIHGVSGEEVQRMLAAGIASEDRRVVDLTLLALNNLTMLYEPALRRVQANPWKSSRPIAGVPGLKRFLMAHWLAHAEGRNHETPMTDIPRPEWFGPFPETVMEDGVSVETPAEFKDAMWSTFVHSEPVGSHPHGAGDSLAGRPGSPVHHLGGSRLSVHSARHGSRQFGRRPVRQREVRHARNERASRKDGGNGADPHGSGVVSRRSEYA